MPAKKDAATQLTSRSKKRTTLAANIETAEKLKAVAYWDHLTLKEAATKILDLGFASYEKKNGPIKLRPSPHE